jgi:protocatechuate 3,4-dioxygenase alpha subunit
MTSHPTPAQTVGPFFEDSLLRDPMNAIADESSESRLIRVEGRVLDGDGAGVSDAMVEVWQANADGLYRHPDDRGGGSNGDGFTGFGRSGTDNSGRYWFQTIKPGSVPSPRGGTQAPHLNVCVFARGLLDHLTTRIYFEDEPSNATDEVLQTIDETRRPTMIATRVASDDEIVYELDIVLQGDAETVFFDPRS